MAQESPTFVTVQSPGVSAAQPQTRSSRYNEKGGRSTGWIQIICGLASIIFGVIAYLVLFGVIDDPSLNLGHVIFGVFGISSWPIWAGIIYTVTGSLGAASKKGRTCLIVAYMVLSIISVLLAIGQLIWEAVTATFSRCYEDPYDSYDDCPELMLSYGIHVGATIAAAVEIIVAITGSVFCCHGVCCTSPESSPVVVQYNNPQSQPAKNLAPPSNSLAYPPPASAPPAYSPNAPPANTKYDAYMEVY